MEFLGTEIPTSTVLCLLGAIVSLLFSFTPKLKTWFEAKSPKFKAGTMVTISILAAVFGFAQGCINGATCEAADVTTLLEYILTILSTNQVTHLAAKQFVRSRFSR